MAARFFKARSPGVPLLVATLLCVAVGVAQARVQEKTGYSKQQAFNAALRFIRVDHGYAVTEKDADSGYLLFQYTTPGSEPTTGSVEVIEQEDGVSVVVQLPKMPEHHERYLASGLIAKLRSEYGEPPAKRPPPSSSSKKDKPKEGEKPDEDKPKEGDAPEKDQSSQDDDKVPGYRIQ